MCRRTTIYGSITASAQKGKDSAKGTKKMKKIIVAGGGHGGIAAAAILAKNGFDVTVYEKNSRDDMGYDWTDIFDRNGLAAAGIPFPSEDKFKLKNNMTFYSTSLSKPLLQNTPEDQLEIQMERKEIYNLIIDHALSCGVKFKFETAVNGPIVLGNRVVGIKTSKGSKYADLVIDACGVHSIVRSSLPASFGIQAQPGKYEEFFVYRAFFNKASDESADKFKLILLNENILGISWVADEPEYADVLIGRFEPFDLTEAERAIAVLRETNPIIGDRIVRGGQFVNIPVRQPLGLMVADGYAAIGDSAFMTVPIIGSGIANSFKAAKILADAVMKDEDGEYSAATLWEYQRNFFKQLGSGLAQLAPVKMLLTRLDGKELDYIFETGILNADDMTIGADDNNLAALFSGIKPEDILTKAKGVIGDKIIFSKIIRMAGDMLKCISVLSAMPNRYNKTTVKNWVKRYNKAFNG